MDPKVPCKNNRMLIVALAFNGSFRGFSMELGLTLEKICQQGAANYSLF
jgi:hypothetical protein